MFQICMKVRPWSLPPKNSQSSGEEDTNKYLACSRSEPKVLWGQKREPISLGKGKAPELSIKQGIS